MTFSFTKCNVVHSYSFLYSIKLQLQTCALSYTNLKRCWLCGNDSSICHTDLIHHAPQERIWNMALAILPVVSNHVLHIDVSSDLQRNQCRMLSAYIIFLIFLLSLTGKGDSHWFMLFFCLPKMGRHLSNTE